MDDPYASTPLHFDTQSFRLLQIHPGEAHCVIRCSLRAFDVGDQPSYTAVSYAWGADATYDEIEVNGVKLAIRENLWHFLHQMRSNDSDIFFWIDAICINQLKIHELNHQVQMMRQIYSNAQSVFIWLGRGNDGTDAAMRRLRVRKMFPANAPIHEKIWNVKQGRGVLDPCTRPYWRRTWIIQEVALAKTALILCGICFLEWSKFTDMIQDVATGNKLTMLGKDKPFDGGGLPCLESLGKHDAYTSDEVS